MAVLFIDGFDNYINLQDKWDLVYPGVTIASGVGRRGTSCLALNTFPCKDDYLQYNFGTSVSGIVTGFAFRRPSLAKTVTDDDIALNTMTTAPHTYRIDETHQNIVNGVFNNFWGTGSAVPQSIVIDLLKERNIGKMQLSFDRFGYETAGDNYNYDLYGSTDRVNWFLTASGTDQIHVMTTHSGITVSGVGFVPLDVTCQYIKVDIYESDRTYSWVDMNTFRAYEYVPNDDTGEHSYVDMIFLSSEVEQDRVRLGWEDITFLAGGKKVETWGENSDNTYRNTSYAKCIRSGSSSGEDTLKVSGTTKNFIKFDLSTLASGVYVDCAKLTVRTYGIDASYPMDYIYANRCLQNWIPNDVNWYDFSSGNLWNVAGAGATTISGIYTDDNVYDYKYTPEAVLPMFHSSNNNYIEVDVTNIVREWVDGSIKNYGFLLDNVQGVDVGSLGFNLYAPSITGTLIAGTDGSMPSLEISYYDSYYLADQCMTSGTWNYVETKVNFDDTNGSAEIRVDETPVLSAYGIGTTVSGLYNSIDSIKFNVHNNPNISNNYVHALIDDLYLASTSGTFGNDFLGVCLVDTLYPSISGTNNDCSTHYSYSDERYELIDGVTGNEDTTYEDTFFCTLGEHDGYFERPSMLNIEGGIFNTSAENIVLNVYHADWAGRWYGTNCFIKISDIDIPKNALILEAKFKYQTGSSTSFDGVVVKLRLENDPNKPDKIFSKEDYYNRSLSEDYVEWIGSDIFYNWESPDISHMIQKLVNEDDWAEIDNSINITLESDGLGYIHIKSRDFSSAQASTLYIKWKHSLNYDEDEYVYSAVSGDKDTYAFDSVSGTGNIYAIQQNLYSKYDIKQINNDNHFDLVTGASANISGGFYFSGVILRVGPAQLYTTIQSAVDVALDGDLVLIDPGTYTETVIITKWIHIKGNELAPSAVHLDYAGVTVQYQQTYDCPFSASYDSKILMEGVTVSCTGTWQVCVYIMNNYSGEYVFNKCALTVEGSIYNYPIAFVATGYTIPTVRVVNCDVIRGYASFLRFSCVWSVESCYVPTYYAYVCSTTPSPADYVEVATYGYGSDYGNFYFSVDEFTGNVAGGGTAAASTIYRAVTNDPIKAIDGSNTTYWKSGSLWNGSSWEMDVIAWWSVSMLRSVNIGRISIGFDTGPSVDNVEKAFMLYGKNNDDTSWVEILFQEPTFENPVVYDFELHDLFYKHLKIEFFQYLKDGQENYRIIHEVVVNEWATTGYDPNAETVGSDIKGVPLIVVSGTEYAYGSSDIEAYYTNSVITLDSNPHTSSLWDKDDINNIELGFKLV